MAEENHRIEEYPTPVLQALAKAEKFPNPTQLPEIVQKVQEEEKMKNLATLRGTPKIADPLAPLRTPPELPVRAELPTAPMEEIPPHIPLNATDFGNTVEVDVDLDNEGSLDDLDPSMDEEEEGTDEI